LETLLVIAIVAAAAFQAGRGIYRRVSGRGREKGACGCAGCACSGACGPSSPPFSASIADPGRSDPPPSAEAAKR